MKDLIPRIHVRIVLDTLEYLRRAGNIGKTQVLLGTILKINHILDIRDGETYPVTRERNREKTMEELYNFASQFNNIRSLAVEYTTTPNVAQKLAHQLNSILPKGEIYISGIGPTVRAHVRPNVVTVTALEEWEI